MSSASARAEARRKAILSRGSDRLAKLTTSARGEDAPAYMKDAGTSSSISSSTRSFLGEDSSDMPAPSTTFAPSPSPSPKPSSVYSHSKLPGTSSASSAAPSTASTPPRAHAALNPNPFESLLTGASGADPSVWSPEQQQQFMRALMTGSAGGFGPGQTPLQSPLGDPNAPIDPTLPPMDNPLAAMLFGGGAAAGGGGKGDVPPGMDLASMFGGAPPPGVMAEPPKPESKWQKFLPVLHLVVLWVLLGYFVFFFEPNVHGSKDYFDIAMRTPTLWERWRNLAKSNPIGGTTPTKLLVQAAPFFWSFMTIEVMLHSIQIFTGSNAVKPPTLLSLALPHLPAPFPSIIINSLKYLRMGSMFLDDLAGVIVGLGIVVYFSGYL